MKVLPVIIAGGFGSRLFPISTIDMPKQFIYFFDKKYSCFQKTVQRLRMVFVTEKIAICCNCLHIKLVKQQLADINEDSYILLVENEPKNTFASVLFCLKFAQKICVDVLSVFSSDSFIQNNKLFTKKIFNAAMFSYIKGKHVIFGVKPKKADDKYGYIQIGNNNFDKLGDCYYDVKCFVEKPSINTAQKLIRSRYYWNSGNFVFNVGVLLKDIKEHQKSVFVGLKNKKLITKNKNFYFFDNNFYNSLPILSVDKAIVEKSHNFALSKWDFEWYDIGSFETLEILLKAGKISIPKEYYLRLKRDSIFLRLISNL